MPTMALCQIAQVVQSIDAQRPIRRVDRDILLIAI